ADPAERARLLTDIADGKKAQWYVIPDPQAPPIKINLKGHKNVLVRARAPTLNNNWLGIVGSIIDEDKDVGQPFDIPIEDYSGVEDGEAWSEGDREKSARLSSLPGGEYLLRLDVLRDANAMDEIKFDVRISQGDPSFWQLVVAVVALSLLPLIVWFMA